MAARKPLSKKQRFEVLKRDRFTCQYCGRQAPDVVLNVDHIKPVSKGGTNDITNLVTSCFDCNQGKKDRELSDDSAVRRQKAQLDMLQERREQLDMMHEWQTQLTSEFMSETTIVADIVEQMTGYVLDKSDLAKVRKLISQFGIPVVCDAVRTAVSHYDPVFLALQKVGGICYCKTHRTCYQCVFYVGRDKDEQWKHLCGTSYHEDGTLKGFASIKKAENCDLFEERK